MRHGVARLRVPLNQIFSECEVRVILETRMNFSIQKLWELFDHCWKREPELFCELLLVELHTMFRHTPIFDAECSHQLESD